MTSKLIDSEELGNESFPVLCRDKETGMIVLFTSKKTGVVLVSKDPDLPIGYYSENCTDYDDNNTWERLSSATIRITT